MNRPLILLALSLIAPAAAKADVIYTFTTTSFGSTDPQLPGIPLNVTYDLSNAVVQSGRFDLQGPLLGNNGPNPQFTGNVGDFTQLTIQRETVTPTFLYGTINTDLTFNAAGDVTSSALQFFGVSEEVAISGVGALASGLVGSDQPNCNAGVSQQRCSVSGSWSHTATTVPEPATFALMAAGLLGLAAVRKQLS